MTPSVNIADYTLGDILGVGTVGTVYACVENSTGKPYAIKKLHPSVCRDPLIRARFKREMLVMNRMRHPNIVACYGGGEDVDGSLYYVMELVDGGTVKGLLQMQQRMHWSVVVELGRQICSALQCAHNNGVVHRDLKPGNLFLSRNGELKLGDFGIARDLTRTDLTSSGMTVGTHGYMAPEQITGDAGITGKADLYSLGCCLFEMLTGRAPFTGENFALLFEQHLRATPARVKSLAPDCPDTLDAIVHQLLSKKPDDRPFNARQVQGVLSELGNQTVSASMLGETIPSIQDVGAGSVASMGHDLLIKQISERLRGPAANNVSWFRLAAIAGVIVLVIVFAIATRR